MAAFAPPLRLLGDVSRLRELGAVRFEIVLDGVARPAFAIRWRGELHAYVNACRHQARELDFGDGRLFDDEANALVCCHHGARYDPGDGRCVAGPCAGARLTPLALEVRGAELWCLGANR